MIVNSLLFACYAILLFISLVGYGLVFNKFYKLSLVNNHNNQFFGEKLLEKKIKNFIHESSYVDENVKIGFKCHSGLK